MELVGTTLGVNLTTAYKRDLLLFDRIAWSGMLGGAASPKTEIALSDLNRLADLGLIFHIDPNHLATRPQADAEYGKATYWMRLGMEGMKVRQPEGHADLVADDSSRELIRSGFDAAARALAIYLRADRDLNAVPILGKWTNWSSQEPADRSIVIRIVIEGLPLPAASHSLDEILAFRTESRSRGLVQGLRVWMNEMASGALTPAEVSDKLEYLLIQYEQTLNLEKMSRDTTWLETFIFPAKGVTEYLSTLGSKLFTVRRAEIALMEVEMAAPGREVAYIVKARERFGA